MKPITRLALLLAAGVAVRAEAQPVCASWTSPALTAGPIARYNQGAAADTFRNRIVLFGGWHPGNLGDTWEWNGTEWQLRSTQGPAPREILTLAFDSARNVTVLFGGHTAQGGERDFGDTWEWNGDSWSFRSLVGPSPRANHALCFDTRRQRTVLFGGNSYGASFHDETWVW